MPAAKQKVYLFNWPCPVGGAGTKVTHLLRLLANEYDWTCVPNTEEQYADVKVRRWLSRWGIKAARWEDLPRRLDGWGLCICNTWWLLEGRAVEARQRGLRLIWSSEMMWHHMAELGAAGAGVLDAVLFTGAAQRHALAQGYAQMAGGTAGQLTRAMRQPRAAEPALRDTVLSGKLGSLRWAETGNYIDPACYRWRDRSRGAGKGGEFVIGRLSRAAVEKFPDDFPQSYEGLGLRGAVRARVMAWSEALAARWPELDHVRKKKLERRTALSKRRHGMRWDLLPAMAEEPAAFLRSLDVFVYELGPHCRESWGRSTVEAMLCGAVPLVPRGGGHHLEHLVRHGVAGFLCADRGEFAEYARLLQEDAPRRFQMSRQAREWAEHELCNADRHRRMWREVLG